MCLTMPNSAAVGRTVAEISPLAVFKMAAVSHASCLKIRNFKTGAVQMGSVNHRAKFLGNRSNGC